ncbi:MAG: SurA N-terminal domain-containing protein [Alphaproteobacteria bacterium]|uniref:SurA N-terminal domain-containing protein n=1 Tax=Candidatus Nitrobium versatile TaxID=2884831 RepID=A0A953M228_9BACT|nr:SurA N-terminal domain-containing protein [Candidatus Nitrobium versatile]
MLQSMRKHARFFYFLFFIVILSFIFWGVGTVDKSTTATVAEIGKEKITAEEYWRTYETMRENLRTSLKGQLTEEMEKSMKLKEVALNSLIEEKVLLASARELGITVSDKELQEAITSDPRFMRDGLFRQDVYFKTLELNRLTPEMFENSVRQQLLLLKMRRLIVASAGVTPADMPPAVQEGKTGEDAKAAEAAQMQAMEKAGAAVRSYVDGLKQQMNVKVDMQLLS